MHNPYFLHKQKWVYATLMLMLSHFLMAQVCPAPADFNLITPCYVNGARTSSPNDDVIVLFNHAAARGTAAAKQVIAGYSEVGTVWGLAYNPNTKKLYAAAFLKRHCDLSPDGLGAIYEIDLTTPTTAGAGTPTLWMDLNSATHLGAGATLFPTETAANRGLGGINQPSHDVWAYTRVGKQGLGDIEISADGTTMYVMDLTNRQVLEINMATKTVTNRYPVNAPANYTNAADRRPFGIKHYNGELYIGVVSSGETSAKRMDIKANVMKLSGSSFVNVYEVDSMAVVDPADPTNDFKVTTYRGNPIFGTGLGWNVYSDNVMSSTSTYAYIQNPVPLVSDIEFDNAGNMVIGIMDWSGHRMGAFNYRADPAFTTLHNIQVQGDVIKAVKSGSTWVKENGVGDFYNDIKSVPDQPGWQDDTFMGGLTISDCNGTDLVVANVQDPFVLNEGGAVWMKTADGLMQTNNTGARVSGSAAGMTIAEGSRIRIYQSQDGQPSTFGKAAGLGDIVGTYSPACVKPNAGPDQAPACAGSTPITTATLAATAVSGGTWTQLGTAPNTATITTPSSATSTVTGLVPGVYQFIWATSATCSDTVKITIPNCTPGIDPICFSSSRVITDNKLGAVCNPPVTPDLFYSFYMIFKNNSGTYDRFKTTDLKFEEYCDGTAKIYGTVCSVTNPNLCLDIVYNMTGRTITPPAGSPYAGFCNAPTGAYYYYTGGTGTLTGKSGGGFNNFSATLVRDGAAFQVGVGANTNENVFGASGWIKPTITNDGDGDWTIEIEPTSGVAHGDFNFNLSDPTPLFKLTAIGSTVCEGQTATLSANLGEKCTVTYTWTGPNGFTATGPNVNVPNAVAGTYTVTAEITGISGTKCDTTANATITINPKPTIVQKSGSPICRNNGTTYTIKFIATGGTVVTTPTFAVTGDSIANIPIATASVTLVITGAGGCKDSMTVNAPVCNQPTGSIGDLIWKDVNDNGLQDLPTEKGVAGVKVNLYAAAAGTKTGSVLQTKTTGTDGLYLFTGLLAGDYIVEIDKTTLKDTCAITPKQNIPGDDTKDSDFNPTSGLSQVITLAPVFNPTTPAEILATNNLTVDAGLVKVCITPTRTVAATNPTCATPGKIELTATNGDKYGISKGVTYTGPAYASATAVGTLPILIKGNISHLADSSWTIRVFNKDNTCFKDTTVTVKALVKDATVSVANGFPVCRNNGTTYTVKFTKSPAGAVVTAKNVATNAPIAVTGDSVANIALSVAKVRLIVTNGVCKDSVDVTAPVCNQPTGSIGDLIWKDVNDNGLQDLPTEKGVAGVKVNLYAAAAGTKTGSVLQTKTTGTDGLYLFTGLLAGDYIVEIDKTTLKDTCTITSKKDVLSDDTKDSDFNPTTGLSQVVTLAPVFNPTSPAQILATNNLTVDAGLVVPCVKSKVTVTAAPVCSADVQTYSLSFSVTGKVGTVKVNKGMLTGSNPYTVTGIPSGVTLKITDSLSAVCTFDTLITGPNCNCNPPLPTLITPSLTACIGDTFPTLKATVIGLATVEWFATATSTTVLFTGLNYKPAGTVTAAGAMFYAQARSTDPTCPTAISTARVMATVNAQDCTKEVDLALEKSINTKIAQIGDVLTYTLKVWNESTANATGVEVTDSIAITVEFQTGSFSASRGTASISGNVIKWTIGNIAANGDTVTLTYRVKATQEGVHFNTAEICKTNEKDVDSTPCNHDDKEDDIDRQCFTVPIKLCPSEKVLAHVPNTYTNVQWYKNGGSTPIASGNEVMLSEIGVYTYTASNQTCPAEGCCPIIIEAGVNCCPVEACVPFTVKKKKK